jgi:hypothetical protein
MAVSVELVERHESVATLKGKGEVDGASTVSARLTLAGTSLRHRDPALTALDERIVQDLRGLCSLLRRQVPAA